LTAQRVRPILPVKFQPTKVTPPEVEWYSSPRTDADAGRHHKRTIKRAENKHGRYQETRKTHLLVDLAPPENRLALEAVAVPPGFSVSTLTGGECLRDCKWEVDVVVVGVERECPFGYRLEDWLRTTNASGGRACCCSCCCCCWSIWLWSW